MDTGKVLHWLLWVGVPTTIAAVGIVIALIRSYVRVCQKDKETIRLVIVQLDIIFKAWNGKTTGKGEMSDAAASEIQRLACTLGDRRGVREYREELLDFAKDWHSVVDAGGYDGIRAKVTTLKEKGLRLIGERGKNSAEKKE